MSDTPRTDEVLEQYDSARATMLTLLSSTLERELNDAKAALSGRTVSCSACNAMAEELAELKKVIRKIYYETETYADGAPDATDHDKLCNDISSQLEPFIR